MIRSLVYFLALTALAASCNGIAHGADLTGGAMCSAPAPASGLAINGDLSAWDLSGAEPVWISARTADKLHGAVALM